MGGINYEELIVELRCAVIEAGGQNHFARKHKISPAYVWGVLHRRQKAGYGIQNALGYRQVTTFEKVEKK